MIHLIISIHMNYSDRPFNLLFTASIGYCIIDGLTIEPELDINLITDA